MRFLLTLIACLPLMPAPRPTAEAQVFRYQKTELEGWTIFVATKLEADEPLCAQVLNLLRVKLWEVARRLPARTVERLRQVEIRIHADREGCPGGVYHPSEDWLLNHDLPGDWARGIEFGNAQNFLAWSRQQPAMVLHELAHAWHHQVLGYDHEGILQDFAAVQAAGSLKKVLYVTGGEKPAYGLNNPQEFFAEMSEAWWSTNDFFPFVQAEVQADFPSTATLMTKCWQAPER